ncbi:MAG: hypothetical protein FWD92_00460 [Methanomassiliicoccaceae archaeon]|nr:hypothetical protein [Methanomassiliicoccaceae archaeon]
MTTSKQIMAVLTVSLLMSAFAFGTVFTGSSDNQFDNGNVRTIYTDSTTYDVNSLIDKYNGTMDRIDDVITFSGSMTVYTGTEFENSYGSTTIASELHMNIEYDLDSREVTTWYWIISEHEELEKYWITGKAFFTEGGEFVDILFDIHGQSILYSDIARLEGVENCFAFLGIPVAIWAVGVIAGTSAAVVVLSPVKVTVVNLGLLKGEISYEYDRLSKKLNNIKIGYTKCTPAELTENEVRKLSKTSYYFVLMYEGKLYFANKAITEAEAKKVINLDNMNYNTWTLYPHMAEKICGPNPWFDPAHKKGYFDHYHKAGHKPAHSFFGLPSLF